MQNTTTTEAKSSAPGNSDRMYPLAETTGEAHTKWLMHRNPVLFTPDADQQWMMGIATEALDAGIFYSSDMLNFIEHRLINALPSDYKTRGTGVEGGVLGMEGYYARWAVETKRDHDKNVAASANLRGGDKIKQAEIFAFGKTSKWNGTVMAVDTVYGNVKLEVSRRGDKNRYTMTLPATHQALSLIVQSRSIQQTCYPMGDIFVQSKAVLRSPSNVPVSQHTLAF